MTSPGVISKGSLFRSYHKYFEKKMCMLCGGEIWPFTQTWWIIIILIYDMLLDCNIEQIYNNLHKRNNAFRDPWSNIFKVSILLIRMLWHSQALSMPVVSWRCLERSRGMTFWKQVEKEMFWKWLHYYIYVLPDQDLFFGLGRRLHTFWYGKPG